VLRNPLEGTALTLKESDFNRKVTKINVDGIREARKEGRNKQFCYNALIIKFQQVVRLFNLATKMAPEDKTLQILVS
jgi:hypothetical protein